MARAEAGCDLAGRMEGKILSDPQIDRLGSSLGDLLQAPLQGRIKKGRGAAGHAFRAVGKEKEGVEGREIRRVLWRVGQQADRIGGLHGGDGKRELLLAVAVSESDTA